VLTQQKTLLAKSASRCELNSDFRWLNGGRTRARTWDPLIKSQLLYQLSYAPVIVVLTDKHTISREGLAKASRDPSQPSRRERLVVEGRAAF
jgi:hypothetical protein